MLNIYQINVSVENYVEKIIKHVLLTQSYSLIILWFLKLKEI